MKIYVHIIIYLIKIKKKLLKKEKYIINYNSVNSI